MSLADDILKIASETDEHHKRRALLRMCLNDARMSAQEYLYVVCNNAQKRAAEGLCATLTDHDWVRNRVRVVLVADARERLRQADLRGEDLPIVIYDQSVTQELAANVRQLSDGIEAAFGDFANNMRNALANESTDEEQSS